MLMEISMSRMVMVIIIVGHLSKAGSASFMGAFVRACKHVRARLCGLCCWFPLKRLSQNRVSLCVHSIFLQD